MGIALVVSKAFIIFLYFTSHGTLGRCPSHWNNGRCEERVVDLNRDGMGILEPFFAINSTFCYRWSFIPYTDTTLMFSIKKLSTATYHPNISLSFLDKNKNIICQHIDFKFGDRTFCGSFSRNFTLETTVLARNCFEVTLCYKSSGTAFVRYFLKNFALFYKSSVGVKSEGVPQIQPDVMQGSFPPSPILHRYSCGGEHHGGGHITSLNWNYVRSHGFKKCYWILKVTEKPLQLRFDYLDLLCNASASMRSYGKTEGLSNNGCMELKVFVWNDNDSPASFTLCAATLYHDKRIVHIGEIQGNVLTLPVRTAVISLSVTDNVGFVQDHHSPKGFNMTFQSKGSCLSDQHYCGYGEHDCYNYGSEHCDGRRNCPLFGGDERGCNGCGEDYFSCSSGTKDSSFDCYSEKDRCDGVTECLRANDELGCTSDLCGPHNGTFLCDDGRCIFGTWKCDGQNDCLDYSDEIGCSYRIERKAVMAAVIGSLVCTLLLVTSLGCTCRLHSFRRRQLQVERRAMRVSRRSSRLQNSLQHDRPPPSYSQSMAISAAYNFPELFNRVFRLNMDRPLEFLPLPEDGGDAGELGRSDGYMNRVISRNAVSISVMNDIMGNVNQGVDMDEDCQRLVRTCGLFPGECEMRNPELTTPLEVIIDSPQDEAKPEDEVSLESPLLLGRLDSLNDASSSEVQEASDIPSNESHK